MQEALDVARIIFNFLSSLSIRNFLRADSSTAVGLFDWLDAVPNSASPNAGSLSALHLLADGLACVACQEAWLLAGASKSRAPRGSKERQSHTSILE